jgi:hypothetical protein
MRFQVLKWMLAAGHLTKVDAKIRQIKEKIRVVITGLPCNISREHIKYNATYVVNWINVTNRSVLNGSTSPWVWFTGCLLSTKRSTGFHLGIMLRQIIHMLNLSQKM